MESRKYTRVRHTACHINCHVSRVVCFGKPVGLNISLYILYRNNRVIYTIYIHFKRYMYCVKPFKTLCAYVLSWLGLPVLELFYVILLLFIYIDLELILVHVHFILCLRCSEFRCV